MNKQKSYVYKIQKIHQPTAWKLAKQYKTSLYF